MLSVSLVGSDWRIVTMSLPNLIGSFFFTS
jgi:hypothetical protein